MAPTDTRGTDTRRTALSVRAALTLPEMGGTEVVAGARGLDREVTGANIVEVPDVSQWLRGGELLFTAGYAWRSDPSQMVEVIHDLDRRNVSGVVFKLGTYFSEIPRGVCAAADDVGLPIIRLPKSVAYMDIIDRLNEKLRDQHARMFERLRESEEQLLPLGLDEQSIERVAAMLARRIDSRIVVVDLVDDVVVTAEPSGECRCCPAGQLDEDLARWVSSVGPSAVPRQRCLTRQSFGGGTTGLYTPLVVSREVRGVLVATEENGTLDQLARHTLAHAGELISFLLLKRLANLEGQRASMALLLHSLLEDRLTAEEATERALAFGLRLQQPFHVLTVGAPDPVAHRDAENLRQDLTRVLGTTPHAVGPDEDRTIVLVQARPGPTGVAGQTGPTGKPIDAIAERVFRIAHQHHGRRAVVGVGGAQSGLDGLRRSRVEALVAYRTRLRTRVGGVVHFSALGVDGLLSQIPSNEVTDLFVRASIGPIADDPELLRTLEVYVECGGRKLATAEKLPLHRSSLEYRLEKITRMLGVDLTKPEHRSELWLALRLRHLTEI